MAKHKRANKTRYFIRNNEGFFSIFFIILFAVEQIVLIGLTTYFKDEAGLLRLIISIFALLVITTASLQKFVIETKRRYDNQAKENIEASTMLIESYRDKINKLIEDIEKSKKG